MLTFKILKEVPFDNVNPDKDVVTFDLQSYKKHEL